MLKNSEALHKVPSIEDQKILVEFFEVLLDWHIKSEAKQSLKDALSKEFRLADNYKK